MKFASGSAAQGGEMRYGFEVAGLRLVAAQGVLTEVVIDAQVHAVPRAAAALVGVLNLRGTIVPLFDVQRLAQRRPDLRPSQPRALIFDRDERRAGFVLQGTPQLVRLSAPVAAVPAAGPLAAFLTQAWAQADSAQTLWWEVDHRRAFAYLAEHIEAELAA